MDHGNPTTVEHLAAKRAFIANHGTFSRICSIISMGLDAFEVSSFDINSSRTPY